MHDQSVKLVKNFGCSSFRHGQGFSLSAADLALNAIPMKTRVHRVQAGPKV
jgi:hypothetical protein